MKEFFDFILFILIVVLIVFLVSGIGIHSVDESDAYQNIKTTEFRIKDNVYILPDSTKGIIEDGFVFTTKQKDTIDNKRKDTYWFSVYKVMYTDKNGVIQRLKNVKSEFLVKR